jgi:hypothetical protein
VLPRVPVGRELAPDVTQQAPEPQRPGPVWVSSRQLGSGGPGLASLGQGPVAILAGFDLTTAILLTTSTGHGGIVQAAIACFGLSAALFILAMAFITAAEDYSASPDVRMTYNPEARVSARELDEQRGMQRQDEDILSIYFNYRIIPCVTLAVLGTLTGLVLALGYKGWFAGVDVAVVGVALVGVIYLIDWLKNGNNWWLFPRPVFESAGHAPTPWPLRVMRNVRSAWAERKPRRASIVLSTETWPMTTAGREAMLGAPAHEAPDGADHAARSTDDGTD